MAEQEKGFQHEADLLAAILEHDDVPQDVCNYISDLTQEFQGEVGLDTPAVLRVVWPLIRQQEHTSGDAFWRSIVIALRAFADKEMDQVLMEIGRGEGEKQEAVAPTDSPADLAAHISAVLTHPATPAPLYEAIANEASRWSGDYLDTICETVPYIESCLLHHQRAQQERTEGGTEDGEQS